RLMALVDPGDPRLAAQPSPRPPTPEPSPVGLPLTVLSEDVIAGSSLLLSVAVGPDGTMYATDVLNHRIVVRRPDGGIESWGERGAEPGKFDLSPVTQNDASASVAVSAD